MLEEALEMLSQATDPIYPELLDVLVRLGHIDLAENRPGQAESRYRQACELIEGVEQPHPSDLAAGYLGLGRSLLALGSREDAREAFTKALGYFEAMGDAERLAEASAEIRGLLDRHPGR